MWSLFGKLPKSLRYCLRYVMVFGRFDVILDVLVIQRAGNRLGRIVCKSIHSPLRYCDFDYDSRARAGLWQCSHQMCIFY